MHGDHDSARRPDLSNRGARTSKRDSALSSPKKEFVTERIDPDALEMRAI